MGVLVFFPHTHASSALVFGAVEMRLSCYTIEKVFSGLKRERSRIHAPLNDPGQWSRRRVLEINFNPHSEGGRT